MRIITSLFFLIIFSFLLSAQETAWLNKYDKNGLQVSVRGKKTNEYKAEIIVNANLQSCLALMQDLDVHTNFMGAVEEISVITQYSDQHYLLKSVIGMPFPMKDQELVSEAKFKVLGQGNSVKVEIKAKPNAIPQGTLKRMTVADGFWLFEKIGESKTKITYQLKFEESNAPNWLVNHFVLDSPIKTLEGFSKYVVKEKYKGSKVAWL
jgi:ribosome-associated toxin RatA of RatAB toxin-antitoxin module